MGRRKIDIAYLTDDRVRKVTFCKRKGGLFKKAEDLSKLCGVEIAVVIIGDKKTSEFASTDVERIMGRYKEMQAGGPANDNSETSRLWQQLEQQRRELEALTRELSAERRKVEELRTSGGVHAMLQPMEVAEHNVALVKPLPGPDFPVLPVHSLLATQESHVTRLPVVDVAQLSSSAQVAIAHVPPPKPEADGNASDDTAEVEDSADEEEAQAVEQPVAKRQKINEAAQDVLPTLPTVQVLQSGINCAALAAE
jgi:hypothetical protein